MQRDALSLIQQILCSQQIMNFQNVSDLKLTTIEFDLTCSHLNAVMEST